MEGSVIAMNVLHERPGRRSDRQPGPGRGTRTLLEPRQVAVLETLGNPQRQLVMECAQAPLGDLHGVARREPARRTSQPLRPRRRLWRIGEPEGPIVATRSDARGAHAG